MKLRQLLGNAVDIKVFTDETNLGSVKGSGTKVEFMLRNTCPVDRLKGDYSWKMTHLAWEEPETNEESKEIERLK